MDAPDDKASHDHHRADMAHYWSRLMWYRDELWRITTPVWAVYGAFIASCTGYVWSSEKGSIPGEIALMLMAVIVSFSWVIQRMYWTYAYRIYAAITELNGEVQKREQFIYDRFLKHGLTSDYGRFRVYPKLNVIFSIVGVAMMFGCLFTVGAAVGFDFGYHPPGKPVPTLDVRLLVELSFALLVVFEIILARFRKHCDVCGAGS